MKRERLLDVERTPTERWTGSLALVHVPTTACPGCGEEPLSQTVAQLPLLRHGGYGAIQQTVRLYCECGWNHVAVVEEINPRSVA